MTERPDDRCPLCGGELMDSAWRIAHLECTNEECALSETMHPTYVFVIAHQLALIEDAHRSELAAVKRERDAMQKVVDEARDIVNRVRDDKGFCTVFLMDTISALDAERGK